MQRLGHTWPQLVFEWQGDSTLQLETKLQNANLSCFPFRTEGVGCQDSLWHNPSYSTCTGRGCKEDLCLRWLFLWLCSQEPKKMCFQAGGNNSRKIQSLQKTIFQTLYVFECCTLFSLRKKRVSFCLCSRDNLIASLETDMSVAVPRQTWWTEPLVIAAPWSPVSWGASSQHWSPSTSA